MFMPAWARNAAEQLSLYVIGMQFKPTKRQAHLTGRNLKEFWAEDGARILCSDYPPLISFPLLPPRLALTRETGRNSNQLKWTLQKTHKDLTATHDVIGSQVF